MCACGGPAAAGLCMDRRAGASLASGGCGHTVPAPLPSLPCAAAFTTAHKLHLFDAKGVQVGTATVTVPDCAGAVDCSITLGAAQLGNPATGGAMFKIKASLASARMGGRLASLPVPAPACCPAVSGS